MILFFLLLLLLLVGVNLHKCNKVGFLKIENIDKLFTPYRIKPLKYNLLHLLSMGYKYFIKYFIFDNFKIIKVINIYNIQLIFHKSQICAYWILIIVGQLFSSFYSSMQFILLFLILLIYSYYYFSFIIPLLICNFSISFSKIFSFFIFHFFFLFLIQNLNDIAIGSKQSRTDI